jgi:hypothetical protein
MAMQRVTYVSNAVPDGDGMQNLQPLGVAGQAAHLALAPVGTAKSKEKLPTSVSLFDQGLSQILEASVSGLPPGQPFVLALAAQPDGLGSIEPLAVFTTNPAGSAMVNAVGPIRQVVRGEDKIQRRYLVILPGTPDTHDPPVQVQVE